MEQGARQLGVISQPYRQSANLLALGNYLGSSAFQFGMGFCHMTSGVMSDLPRQLTVIRFQMTALQKKIYLYNMKYTKGFCEEEIFDFES